MECSEVQGRIMDLLEGNLDKETKHIIMEHMEKCHICGKEYGMMNKVCTTVRKGYRHDKEGLSAPHDTRHKLETALDNEKKPGNSYMKVFKKGGIAAAIVLIMFFTAINISPTAAYYLHNVPVVQNLIELGLVDKGLINAVEGDVGQLIEESVWVNGIGFTVHEVVASDNRTVVFYSIDWPNDWNMEGIPPRTGFPTATRGIGFSLFWRGGVGQYDEENNRSSGILEFDALRGMFTKVAIEIPYMELGDKTKVEGPWRVSFSVDRNKAEGKQYRIAVNESISGQKGSIIIDEIVNTPSETYVYFKLTGNVIEFGDIILLDQDGREYDRTGGRISLGDTKSGGHWMFTLTYPDKAEKIIVSSIKENIVVDAGIPIDLNESSYPKEAVINHEHWSIVGIERQGDTVKIKVPVMEFPVEKIIRASLTDENGNVYIYGDDYENKAGSTGGSKRTVPVLPRDDIEKAAAGDRAVFYQTLTFSGIDEEMTSFILTVNEAVVYTTVNKEIIIDNK